MPSKFGKYTLLPKEPDNSSREINFFKTPLDFLSKTSVKELNFLDS